jgi:hypothetical protein
MYSKAAIAALTACLYAALAPSPAMAYFLPLVGAGGVIISGLIGFMAVLFSVAYLIGYKIYRMLRRAPRKEDDHPPAGDMP